jgi:hypothetical protein
LIPKIIHQTAPAKKDEWHPLWEKCQKSWLEIFSEFEYKFWNDEDIDRLIREEYPEFWDTYQEFPVHIMKIDFVRLAFLHKFGGIYADMDYFCYQNFYDDLKDKAYVVENPFGNDPIENSLMASEKNHSFFYECMKEAERRFRNVKQNYNQQLKDIHAISSDKNYALKLRPMIIFYISGTTLISDVYRENANIVSTLPGFIYNNLDYSYHPSFKARHSHTGLWGKENIEVVSEIKDHYKYFRNIPLDQYDFYTDYSKGKYLKENIIDFDKNESFSKVKLKSSYGYS